MLLSKNFLPVLSKDVEFNGFRIYSSQSSIHFNETILTTYILCYWFQSHITEIINFNEII